jgi:hypothetical protein
MNLSLRACDEIFRLCLDPGRPVLLNPKGGVEMVAG